MLITLTRRLRRDTVPATIYLAPEIHKRLEALRRRDKKAFLAAVKAEEIIGRMRAGMAPSQAGSVTKHGEARIKGVVKHDLGSGYRLVSLRQGGSYYVLFAGTHDDCHRWLENNRALDINIMRSRCKTPDVAGRQLCETETPDCHEALAPENALDPLAELTDQELREVFCGLAHGAP